MSLNEAAGSENAEAYAVVTLQCSRRPRTKLKGIFRVMNGGMFKKVNGKAAASEDSRRTAPGTSRIQATRERRRWTFSTSRKSRSGGMADTHV